MASKIMKIIKNLLSSNDLQMVQDTLMSEDFPWFYRATETTREEDGEYFTHNFIRVPQPGRSNWYYALEPILPHLNISSLIMIRANLCVNSNVALRSRFHTDNNDPRVTTAIFYVNTNNGMTMLRTPEGIIESPAEENKIIIFPSQTHHQSVRQTDTKQRVVINFNFYGK